MCMVFSYTTSLNNMLLLACINAFPQAGGYPALAKLVYEWFSPHQYGKVFTFISVGSRAGSALSSIVIGSLLMRWDWRQAIRLCPFVVLIIIFSASYFCSPSNTRKGRIMLRQKHIDEQANIKNNNMDDKDNDTDNTTENEEGRLNFGEQVKKIAFSKQFWLISLASGCLLMSKGFEAFVPVYLTDTLGCDSSTAAICSSTIPLGIICSLILGGWILETKVERKSRWQSH
eukprot:UN25973